MLQRLRINDLRVDGESPTLNIIYDGSISLWRASKNLDVLIVEHVELFCFELIVFDAVANQKFPSIFLNATSLQGKIKPEALEAALQEQLMLDTDGALPMSLEQLQRRTMGTLQTSFVLSRLSITNEADKISTIYLQPHLGDSVVDIDDSDVVIYGASLIGIRLDFVIPKPVDLTLTETIILPALRVSVFTRCLDAFHGQATEAAQKVNAASNFCR